MADPQKYRDDAERIRKEAFEISDLDIRCAMLDIADLNERLAATLETRPPDKEKP
jgi:hypothetical protein